MDEAKKKNIEEMLASLGMVQWDRYVNPAEGEYWMYGWIDREDGKKDFVVVSKVEEWWWYITSSKIHTDEIGRIINGENSEHSPCIRIEDTFKIPNMIKL